MALNERLLKDFESRLRRFNDAWELTTSHESSLPQASTKDDPVSNGVENVESLESKAFESLTFGDIFVEYAPLLRMYSQYANNYGMACSVLNPYLSRHEAAAELIREAESNSKCTGQTFFSFLIMPIQRVPRYELLLRELLKNSSPDHRDKELLEKALADVASSAQFINEAIKEREVREEMMKV